MTTKYIFPVFLIFFLLGCKKEETPTAIIDHPIETENCAISEPNSDDLINGDPLPIVAGKIVSYAVSTEDECAYSPPGKWLNTYGTVYYRYVERAAGGSVNQMVKRSAEAVASLLTAEQLDKFLEIIPNQTQLETQGRINRDLISRELYKWKSGTSGDKDLILNLAQENGELLYEMVKERTSLYGEIAKELSENQLNEFCLARNSESTKIDPIDLENLTAQTNSSDDKKELNLVLAKFFSWITSTEAMTRLVDDGRPAVYFGFANLRIEDREGDDVSSGLRKETSDLLLATLNNDQMEILNNLVAEQDEFLQGYYQDRGDLASLLKEYQTNSTVDQIALQAKCINSEVKEAQLGIIQAEEMGAIIQSFNESQLQTLIDFKEGN